MSLEILLGWVTVVIQLGEYYDWGSNLQVSSIYDNNLNTDRFNKLFQTTFPTSIIIIDADSLSNSVFGIKKT